MPSSKRSTDTIHLLCWNVNGLRSVLKKGFKETLLELKPDIVCLQEIRLPGEALDLGLPQYHCYWNHAQKKGYSGTAVLTQIEPLNVKYGMGIEEHDQEGRVIVCEYKKFFLVNVYVPNSKRDLSRLDYRSQKWDVDFLKFLKKLEKDKPVIFCGDLNVAHTEDDLSNPKGNAQTHGFTKEERAGFENMIQAGFVDTFRLFKQGNGHYTWWSQFNNCRKRNIGWRIDSFLASASLKKCILESNILPHIFGSDHCPIELILKIS